MRIKKNVLAIVAFLFLYIFLGINTKADIYDEANLLNYTEKMELQNLVDEYEKTTKMNIIIWTFYGNHGSNLSYSDAEYYIDRDVEAWYDDLASRLNISKKDKTIIFAIDMSSRTTVIVGYDKLSNIDFSNNSSIVNATTSYLADGNYYKAIEYFITHAKDAVFEKYLGKVLIAFVISLIISIVVCSFLVMGSKGKQTTTLNTYLSNKSRLVNKSDIFIKTDVRRVKKESSSSSGGGGGGRSHGGGGHGHF